MTPNVTGVKRSRRVRREERVSECSQVQYIDLMLFWSHISLSPSADQESSHQVSLIKWDAWRCDYDYRWISYFSPHKPSIYFLWWTHFFLLFWRNSLLAIHTCISLLPLFHVFLYRPVPKRFQTNLNPTIGFWINNEASHAISRFIQNNSLAWVRRFRRRFFAVIWCGIQIDISPGFRKYNSLALCLQKVPDLK